MAFNSLNDFVCKLEKEGELVRIKHPVSVKYEITEIVDRVVKNGGPALLFTENGTDFPLLINAFGSEKRMCIALGIESLDEVSEEIQATFKTLMSPGKNLSGKLKLIPHLRKIAGILPKVKSGRGACQEIINHNPDLSRLPVLTCWPHDGGPFITLPVVHTRDLTTGVRNVGMYRMQIMSNNTTGMHWQLHKGSAKHFEEYKAKGELMPVVVTLGGDPVYTYVATAPLPENVDEYLLAGFIRKKAVQLVKCITCDIEVPADVDFVIEGYVDPGEPAVAEGPFGDHTGYYSLKDFYPLFHVKCITHRKNAVYPATIVGIPPQEDAWLAKATERIFLAPVKMALLPEIIDMSLPAEGVFHNICIVKIKKNYAGQAIKVMNALWGAGQMMFNKYLVVVDETVNVHNYDEVLKAVINNCDVPGSFSIIKGPLDILDHSGPSLGFGSKMGIDATVKLKGENSFSDFQNKTFIAETVKKEFHDVVVNIGEYFLNNNQPLVTIGLRKSKSGQVKDIHQKLVDAGFFDSVKMVIYFDEQVELDKMNIITWIASGNTDPARDVCFSKMAGDDNKVIMGMDATRKTFKYDNFKRAWPNVIVSDDITILKVDNIWKELNLGCFLESPSKYCKSLVMNGGAEVEEP